MKRLVLSLAILGGIFTACNNGISEKEQTAKASEILSAYPNATVEVKDGTAHVMGTFSSEEEKKTALSAVGTVEGVKDVMDMAVVSADGKPVENIADAMQIHHNQEKVKAALENFPSVSVEVINNEITLTGNVSATQEKRINEIIKEYKFPIHNNLVVK